MPDSRTLAHEASTRPAWQSWARGLAALALVSAAALLPRLGQLTLRGEETRRARVAWEMAHGGGLLVPRLQGVVYTSRPPLANWLIVGAAALRGQFDLFSARAPSLLATLLSAWMVYAYCRAFVSPSSAWVAGLAYLSCWKVLELGRLAETEAVLALWTGAALLAWHAAYARGWPSIAIWTIGYGLAGLAALTKGLQPIVYFALITAAFLAWRRDWSTLFSWGHACGALTLAVVVGAWWVPYLREVGWQPATEIWLRNVTERYEVPSGWALAQHLISYPFEALFSLLPWSALLLVFVWPQWRRGWGELRGPLVFLSIALAVALASCWVATEARTRYLMPVAPCVAAVVGLVVERLRRATETDDLHRAWRDFSQGYALALVGVASIVMVASAGGWLPRLPLHQTLPTALIAGLVAMALALTLARMSAIRTPAAPIGASVLIALSVIGAYDALWMNWLVRRAERTAQQVAKVRQELPPEAQIVSFGALHHAFLFHVQSDIPQLPWPRREISVPDDVEYFCFHETRQPRDPLPFAWEKVAEISCDRHRRDDPFDRVLVGRRLHPRIAHTPSRGVR